MNPTKKTVEDISSIKKKDTIENPLPISQKNTCSTFAVLSTKKLSSTNKKPLIHSEIELIEYDAIKIELFDCKIRKTIQNAIFSSKNAVKAVHNLELNIENCFCVGDSTRQLLEKNGQKVVVIAQNAADLAKIIVQKHKKEQFLFFCGSIRRDDLPLILKKNDVVFEEKIVYQTHLIYKKMNRLFDGILFFSPSGVQSYVKKNSIGNSVAFCIGKTTATEAKKHCNTIITANTPSIEDTIDQVVQYFNKNKIN